jgi:hypothetical protein
MGIFSNEQEERDGMETPLGRADESDAGGYVLKR